MDNDSYRALVNTALGREKADLAIVNGVLANVYTGEFQPGISVAIKGERIACVGTSIHHAIGPNTEVFDAAGHVLIPGFIDGHTHTDSIYTIGEMVRCVIPAGTTTVVTEASSVGNTLGHSGILQFIENLRDQPILLYTLVPSHVPISPEFESSSVFPPEKIDEVLRLPEIAGVGETFWARVVDLEPIVSEIVRSGLRAGKPVQGHSSGAKGNKLMAYIAAGISSCHEPITMEEAVERLRMGLHVMIREGSLRRDLEAVAPIKDLGLDLRRMILCSDGLWPRELVRHQHMNYVVQRAIDLGFDPMAAIQMATLNVAEHFGLDRQIGGIAPHRYANVCVIPDMRTVDPEHVFSKGRLVAAHGELLAAPRKDEYPDAMRRSVHLPRAFTAEDFRVVAPPDRAIFVGATGPSKKDPPGLKEEARVKVRTLQILREIIVGEAQLELPVVDGEVRVDAMNDIIKVAIINRHDGAATRFVGFINGFGLRDGAYAATLSWDSNNLVIVGADEADMATAATHIREIGGGVAFCEKGRIYQDLPLPIGGVISDLPMEEIDQRLSRIEARLRELGTRLPNPFLSLQTLAFTPLPYLRITERGLIDVRQNKRVELFVDE